jgi:endonuclease YncB( thermonuclease family)
MSPVFVFYGYWALSHPWLTFCLYRENYPTMKKLFVTALAMLMLCGAWASIPVKGKVVAVIDGNTFKVKGEDNETRNIVLIGIDSPELGQAYGPEAKRYLEKLILGKKVVIYYAGNDTDSPLIEVKILGVKDPRIEMLKEGLAWTTRENPPYYLEQHRETAQLRGRGLWQQSSPTPPWVYREEQRRLAKRETI